MTLQRVGLVAVLGTSLLAARAAAQTSRCADCHFARPDAPAPEHVLEWDLSAHGRNDVGCEKCHGGDATTFEPFLAHRGILSSGNPASPTNERNLPKTCGQCHIGPFVEFQKSRHYEALVRGDERAPSCTTCHGDVGAHLLSPRGLEARCAECHGPNGVHPNPDYPPQGRILLEGVIEVRGLLEQARRTIRRIEDPERRERLELRYRQAEVPLVEAVHDGHSFSFDRLEERLAVARERVEALLEELANPPPSGAR